MADRPRIYEKPVDDEPSSETAQARTQSTSERTFLLAQDVLIYLAGMEEAWRQSDILACEENANHAREALHTIRVMHRPPVIFGELPRR